MFKVGGGVELEAAGNAAAHLAGSDVTVDIDDVRGWTGSK